MWVCCWCKSVGTFWNGVKYAHTHTHNFTTQMFISSTLGSWCLNLTNYRTLEHLFIASIAIAIMLVLCNISIYIYIYIYMVYIYSYRTKVSSEIIQLYHCTSSCLYNTYTHTNLFFVCTLKKYILKIFFVFFEWLFHVFDMFMFQ